MFNLDSIKSKTSVTLKEYFEIKNQEYTTVKLTSAKDIKNGSSYKILYLLEDITKTASELIKFESKRFKKFKMFKKIIVEQQASFKYVLDIEKNNISIYLIFPSQYSTLFIEKIRSIYKTIKVEEVEKINPLEKATNYILSYKNEDALALNIDKRENKPINNILNVLEIVKDGDHLRIIYDFKGTTLRENAGFNLRHKETMQKIKDEIPVIKNKNAPEYKKFVFLNILTKIGETVKSIVNELLIGPSIKEDNKANLANLLFLNFNNNFKLSESSKDKNNSTLVKTSIIVQSKSNNEASEKNNLNSVLKSFNSVKGDNELIPSKLNSKNNIDPYNIKLNPKNENIMSIEEAGQFIQMPSQETCRQYGINHIETTQTKIPKDLTNGIACIGIAKYREEQIKAYLSTDKDLSKLSLAIVGPTRAGKSTLIANLVRDYIRAGQCVIMLDYIGNCELSKQIINQIPEEKVLVINTTDKNNLEALDYSELNPTSTDIDDIYDSAKNKATKVVELINIMNKSTDDFTALMQSLFKSALEVAFSLNKTINDAITILQDPSYREKIFKSIPEDLEKKMKANIRNLNQLTKKEKNKVLNNDYMIAGIISRLNTLKSNSILEKMLLADPKQNISLIDEMQKNQLIAIQIPEGSYFNTDSEKDIICSFWLTRLVQSMQKRKQIYSETPEKMVTVNLVIDEVYTVEQCQQTLEKYLSRFAKFYVKIIITAHYINQLKMKGELKSANTSYMFLGGSEIQNYIEMKQTFKILGYSEEDFVSIPRFHSLNIIKCEEGFKGFITELPKKIILKS